ncbi:MAG: glycosyltransferase WbuB [Phycisphaerae bacterium]|nr:glycosyltransferase WbuB [Phycisphaerae bacterium]
MHILLVNQYAGSERHGMEYRPFQFAREWARSGHRVTIAAGSFSHVRQVNPNFKGMHQEEFIDGVRYIWFKTPTYHGNGLARARSMLSFSRLARYKLPNLLADDPPSCVIASSTHTLDAFSTIRIARRFDIPLIYEVHDLWPLSPIELGGISRWNPFMLMLQIGENMLCRNASSVISILPLTESHLTEHGLGSGRFHHVPNGIDIDQWNSSALPLPDHVQSTIDECRAQGHMLVGYAGSHGPANSLNTLLDAANQLEGKGVSFLLVGDGSLKQDLVAAKQSIGLQNVHFLDAIPKRAVRRFVESMDVLYIGWRKQPLYRFGISPNKLMDYMMAGKPIIQGIDAGNDIVAEAECGLSIGAEDPDALSEAVIEMQAMSQKERAELGNSGRTWVLENRDLKILADKALSAMSNTSKGT